MSSSDPPSFDNKSVPPTFADKINSKTEHASASASTVTPPPAALEQGPGEKKCLVGTAAESLIAIMPRPLPEAESANKKNSDDGVSGMSAARRASFGRQLGAKNWSTEEETYLLNIVSELMPRSDESWDAVFCEFQSRSTGRYSRQRDAVKERFYRLKEWKPERYEDRNPGRAANIRRARAIRLAIKHNDAPAAAAAITPRPPMGVHEGHPKRKVPGDPPLDGTSCDVPRRVRMRGAPAPRPPPLFTTSDLCDTHAPLLVESMYLKDYGGAPSFHGRIETVRCFESNLSVKEALSEPGKDKVLVVDGGASRQCALLGDMLAGMAASNGWAGVVVNGCIRDSRIIGEKEIGVKAMGVCPLRSQKNHPGQRSVMVAFAGVEFVPGHFLYADADGIVVSELNLLEKKVQPENEQKRRSPTAVLTDIEI